MIYTIFMINILRKFAKSTMFNCDLFLKGMGWLLHTIRYFWKPLLVLLTPVFLSPIATFHDVPEARCGYVIIVMTIFWMTEALPLAVTGLIPVFAFPLLGVLSTGEVCKVYMNDSNMVFLGGMIMAVAFEHCKLDRRISLLVLNHCGQSYSGMLAGIMAATMFLSMWINNAAAAAVMVPIAHAIMHELEKKENFIDKKHRCVLPKITVTDVEEDKENGLLNPSYQPIGILNHGFQDSEDHHSHAHHEIQVFEGGYSIMGEEAKTNEIPNKTENYKKCLFLGIAYAANIGGTGVLTGTPPNLLLVGILRNSFGEVIDLTYLTWMAVNIPGMIICVFLSWIWLLHMYTGLSFRLKKDPQKGTVMKDEKKKSLKVLLESEYNELGSMSFHEWVVSSLFVILVFLWIFREPGIITGWADLIEKSYGNQDLHILNATPVMFIIVILFTLPSKWPSDMETVRGSKEVQCGSCITWECLNTKIPWGIILLMGGGFAIAEASKKSNLPELIGVHLNFLSILPVPILVLIFTMLAIVATNVASNNATAAIFLPILRELSIGLCVNPLYFMLPVTICCSFAFMLPVATPPNAIVYEAAKLRTADLMKVGLGINIMCVIVVNILINTLGVAVLDLNNFPSWVNSTTAVDFHHNC